MSESKTAEWLMWLVIFATLTGPVLAVQTQKFIERLRDKRQRKLRIFHTLMATRAARVSPGHVEALNMIDIVFYGSKQKEKRILESWKIYQDHLNHLGENPTTEELNAWSRKGDDLFTGVVYSWGRAGIAADIRYAFGTPLSCSKRRPMPDAMPQRQHTR
jgi:hypothetical protein